MRRKSFTRKDVARRASFKLNMSNEQTKVFMDCFFEILHEMIIEPEDLVHIEIRDFGVFDVFPTKSRQNARNPRTKEKVVIPPRRKVVFKPSKKIKNELYKSKKFN
tara:strand:+ start:468 stop:785 length:318 start_codon:yes stop_codon:yes gene_type:complete